jgi:hypothetical protein
MISMSCRSCGEKNDVESFLSAAQQNCKSCGSPLMGESLAQPAARRGEPKPWERLDQAPAQVGAGTRNISIQIVAYLNFAYGALYMLCGLFFWIMGSVMDSKVMATAARQAQQQGKTLDVAQAKMMFNILAAVAALLGIPMILAGVGLLSRSPWARYLALVLATLSAGLAVFNVGYTVMNHAKPDLCSLIMYASYSGMTFFVLFQPEVVREFGGPPSESEAGGH